MPKPVPVASGELLSGVMGLLAHYHGPRDVESDDGEAFVEELIAGVAKIEVAYRKLYRCTYPELNEIKQVGHWLPDFKEIS